MSEPAPEATDPQSDTVAAAMAATLTPLGLADLSADTIERAKLCVLDYLASVFVSLDLDWGRQAIQAAAAAAGPGTIVGCSEQAACAEAAFANAVLGHGLVRDDMHVGSISHLGVVVIPPALAVAEARRAGGAALIAAIVAGYEAGGRIGRAILDVDVARIHRPTGITGPVAGAVAAGKLAELTANRLASAIGIAANTAAGYNEWAATGGSEMFFHVGFAARNAVTSVDLAAAGAFVSPTAVEGPAGLLAAFGKRRNAGLIRPLSGNPEILEVFFKEVPACNFAQTAAQAARAVAIAHDISPNEIRRVHVRVPHAAAAYPGCDAPGPFAHTLQAKMSIQYNVAAALLERGFDEASYVPAGRADIVALARTIELEVDPELTARYPAQQGAEVRVTVPDGTRTRRQEDVIPAADGLVRERFTAAATARLGSAQAQRLLDVIEHLEDLDDTATLLELCRPHGARETASGGAKA